MTLTSKLFLLLILLLTIPAVGCNFVDSAIDQADAKMRLKWSEEWKPALLQEAKDTGREALEIALKSAQDKLASQVDLKLAEQQAKLDLLGVKKENYTNDTAGAVKMLQDAMAANAQKPPAQQLPFWELALAVAAAYLPLTAAKEAVLKKRVA